MSELDDLYQELILDHNRSPRNRGKLDEHNGRAEGFNPLCGDHVTVYLNLKDNVVTEVTFEGSGCAISTASASLMTETLKGKDLTEVETLFQGFHDLVTGKGGEASQMGKLAVFHGVSEFPVRVKCATLVWHTLQAALQQTQEPATTE